MGRSLTWPTPAARANIRQKPPLPDLGPGISQRFKPNGVHTGLDFFWLSADVAGSRLVYGQKGIVSRIVRNDPKYGNCVYVQVTDGWEVATAHNPSDIRVAVGQVIDANTLLCPMGNTGSAAAGQYHSHQSIIPKGGKFAQGVDPWPYFNGSDVGGTDTVPDPAPAAPTLGNTFGDHTITLKALSRRRATPTANGTVLEVKGAAPSDAYCDGYTDEGEAVAGSTRWYHDGGAGFAGWYHASVVTAVKNVAALTRMNPDGSPWTASVSAPPVTTPVETAPDPTPTNDDDTDAPIHKVTFDWNDDDLGTTNVEELLHEGDDPSEPEIPDRDGWVFDHWELPDGTTYDTHMLVGNADLTVLAIWRAEPPTETPAPGAEQKETGPAPVQDHAPTQASVWVLIATAAVGGIGWLIAWLTSLFN